MIDVNISSQHVELVMMLLHVVAVHRKEFRWWFRHITVEKNLC